ncbi:MAG TPA: acyl-CoA dehydrogenase family protein [Pseudonocardiaceae bacterium]|nr:acyl-CoA dehydrogenase family protein [Pseudonocardiaceae bacterium]
MTARDECATPCLTAEHAAFRARVREDLDRIVGRHATEWEQARHIPREGWHELGAAGLLSLAHAGEGFLCSAIFLEELGATGYAGIRAAVGVHAYLALSYLELFGTPEQRRTYLAPARRGERIAALAITEAVSGSDLRHIRTTAEPEPDGGYLVKGEKSYVANGCQADFFVMLTRTRPGAIGRGLTGAGLIIVDGDSVGVCRGPQDMLGWHGADVCHVELRDVRVPAGRVIGRPDRALLHLMRALDFERLVVGMMAVGGTRYCLDLVSRFVREHQIRDAPLSANQAVRHRLAALSADFELVRQYAYHCAWLHSRGELDTRAASILKLRATEVAVAAAQTCVQYHGARGYLNDSASARLYRDAIAGTIAAGATELLLDMIFDLTQPDQPA